MSGDTTLQSLKRLTWLPERDADKNGTLIAGQEYYDVLFTGGDISGVIISGLGSPLAISDGGTGQTTAQTAIDALLPSQASANGKFLTSDGTNASWATNPLGTVTSVDVSGGATGLTTSGGPITTSGTITLAGTLGAANGGTGQTSYAVGDILYASASTTLSKLADVATGNALISGGTTTAPAWGKIGLTTHVSGVLPVANGGTNASSASITAFNNITGYTASGATGTTSTNLVFSTSPTLVTPVLGAATATSINKTAITAPATSSTFAVADGKTFIASNTLTLSGTDGSTLNVGAGGTLGTMATQNANAVAITGGDGAFTSSLSLTINQNGLTAASLNNNSTGTGAIASFGVVNNVSTGLFGTAGSNYTGIALLQGCVFVDANAALNGLVLNCEGAKPIIFGTSNTERARIDTAGGLLMAAGTTTVAPIKLTSGTNLTSAAAGAYEYDGVQIYNTIDTSSGRGAVPVEQYNHLTADGGTISTIANFFGATSNISLVASAYYVIDIYLYFLNTTAGTVTWTLTNSAAPTSQNIYFEMSPVTGVVAPPGTATNLFGNYVKDATAARAFTTGTLTTAVDHYAYFRIELQNGSGTSLKIQATKNVGGTITPRLGSYWIARRMSPNNIGTFAA